MKIPKFKPRGKWVLVERDSEDARVSKYGLVTPSNIEQEAKSSGTVLSVGPEIKDIKKGDRVVFETFAGSKMPLQEGTEKRDLLFLHDDDILSHIED